VLFFSTNPELLEDTTDNLAKVEIPVTATADITIYGSAILFTLNFLIMLILNIC
jgi:hypothetical protein